MLKAFDDPPLSTGSSHLQTQSLKLPTSDYNFSTTSSPSLDPTTTTSGDTTSIDPNSRAQLEDSCAVIDLLSCTIAPVISSDTTSIIDCLSSLSASIWKQHYHSTMSIIEAFLHLYTNNLLYLNSIDSRQEEVEVNENHQSKAASTLSIDTNTNNQQKFVPI